MLFKNKKTKETFDEFLSDISKIVDMYMLKRSKKKGISYTGGECEISINSKKSNWLDISIVLYGKLKNEKWIKDKLLLKRPLKSFKDNDETKAKLEQIKNAPMKIQVAATDSEV